MPFNPCVPDKTAVAIVRRQQSGGDSVAAFWSFSSMLRALDACLKGSSTQSWGILIWGSGDGIDGAATPATPFATLFGDRPFDYAEFMALLDEIHPSLPSPSAFKLLDLARALRSGDPQAVAEQVFEIVPDLVAMKKEHDEMLSKGTRSDWTGNSASGHSAGQKQSGKRQGPSSLQPAPRVEFYHQSKPAGEHAKAGLVQASSSSRVSDQSQIMPSGWVKMEIISGQIHSAEGRLCVYTEPSGARCKVREWCDGQGKTTFQLIERTGR
ncbi:MAG: hypothetical protein KF757_04960 [Phycisphaeraceae bacterium]|nr:hypothetical protein [Phycisphaeraceae bacterium]MCW5763883.1 hypothetical protein [Phycisphaeraceae bacterium]